MSTAQSLKHDVEQAIEQLKEENKYIKSGDIVRVLNRDVSRGPTIAYRAIANDEFSEDVELWNDGSSYTYRLK